MISTAGVVVQRTYDGEEYCYNPTYELTSLGIKVLDQFKEMKNNGS